MPHDNAAEGGQSDAITLLKRRLSKFETEEGRLRGLSYNPRSDDVVITTTPKAGTTWLQQICHQIRSAGDNAEADGDGGGDMNFDEISRVVPWLELAYDQGQDLDAPQYGHGEGKPRLFKTHAWAKHCPPFPKVIVVLRDPVDVVVSFYRFFEGWFFEPGTVGMDEFAREFWLARGIPDDGKMQNASYFVHLTSWYERRDEDDVLVLCFEDLKENLRERVREIAKFLSTGRHDFDRPEIIDAVARRSTFEYMKSNEDKFDEKLSKLARNEACGLPRTAGLSSSKLVNGVPGTGRNAVSEELLSEIQSKWDEVVKPVTGCSTYEELRKQLSKRKKNAVAAAAAAASGTADSSSA